MANEGGLVNTLKSRKERKKDWEEFVRIEREKHDAEFRESSYDRYLKDRREEESGFMGWVRHHKKSDEDIRREWKIAKKERGERHKAQIGILRESGERGTDWIKEMFPDFEESDRPLYAKGGSSRGTVSRLIEKAAAGLAGISTNDLRENEREAAELVNEGIKRGIIDKGERVNIDKNGMVGDTGDAFNSINHMLLASKYHKFPLDVGQQMKEVAQAASDIYHADFDMKAAEPSIVDLRNNRLGFEIGQQSSSDKERNEMILKAVEEGKTTNVLEEEYRVGYQEGGDLESRQDNEENDIISVSERVENYKVPEEFIEEQEDQVREQATPEDQVREQATPEDQVRNDAIFWGATYQTGNDPEKIEKFIADQENTLVSGVEASLNRGLGAFVGDKGITNQSVLRRVLIGTARHESRGGRILEQLGNGPARGAWQGEPATAKDILNTSGLIGPRALKILGESREDILKMDDSTFSTFLEGHDVNAVFAIAKYLQSADAKDRLSYLQGHN